MLQTEPPYAKLIVIQTNFLCAWHLIQEICVFFLAAAIFVRTSPQDNPKGNLEGKFQNKTK